MQEADYNSTDHLGHGTDGNLCAVFHSTGIAVTARSHEARWLRAGAPLCWAFCSGAPGKRNLLHSVTERYYKALCSTIKPADVRDVATGAGEGGVRVLSVATQMIAFRVRFHTLVLY